MSLTIPIPNPTVSSFTEVRPAVPTEGRSELEGPSPQPSGETSGSATEARPEMATTPYTPAYGPAGIFFTDQNPETKNGV